MLTRRQILAGTVTTLVAPIAARASTARTARVGWLLPDPKTFALDPFRQRLRELGWVEGGNLVIEQRYTHGVAQRYAALAAELVGLKLDVIVSDGSAATRAFQRTTSTIPIVFVSGNPVVQGFVTSLSNPGKNLTGVAILTGDLTPKRIQFLKEAAPGITRLAVLEDATSGALNASDARLPGSWHAIEVLAHDVGIQALPIIQIRKPEELRGAFERALSERAGGVLVLASPFFSSHGQQLGELAAKARLPAIYEHRGFVEAGGLMSYGPDHRHIFGLVASYVDKILRGARPSELPVEQPTTFELVINVNTAKALDLTIPPSLLARANDVIQ